MEITGAKHIQILHICYTDDKKSKEFLMDKNLSQVCFTDKGRSKKFNVNATYKEESESKCVHKSINKEKSKEWSRALGTFGYGYSSFQGAKI